MQKFLRIVPLTVALTLLFGTFSYGAGHCEAVVIDQIDRSDFDAADVRKIAFTAQRLSGQSGMVRGFDASVSFNSCKGSLVVSMNKECRIKQIYTRGDCRSAQIPSY